MKLRDDETGIEIDLSYDGDGYPLVSIDLGDSYQGEHYRPAVEVKLNDVMIHDMFDEEDERWDDAPYFVVHRDSGETVRSGFKTELEGFEWLKAESKANRLDPPNIDLYAVEKNG